MSEEQAEYMVAGEKERKAEREQAVRLATMGDNYRMAHLWVRLRALQLEKKALKTRMEQENALLSDFLAESDRISTSIKTIVRKLDEEAENPGQGLLDEVDAALESAEEGTAGKEDARPADQQETPQGDMPKESDELIQASIELVRATGLAKTGAIQRRLRLGYTRAARVLAVLEERGVVGPMREDGTREVLRS